MSRHISHILVPYEMGLYLSVIYKEDITIEEFWIYAPQYFYHLRGIPVYLSGKVPDTIARIMYEDGTFISFNQADLITHLHLGLRK